MATVTTVWLFFFFTFNSKEHVLAGDPCKAAPGKNTEKNPGPTNNR